MDRSRGALHLELQPPLAVRRLAAHGVDGQVLTVKYKVVGKPDEEKKLIVTPKTIIATTVPGTKADLKPGLKIFVPGAPKLPDGSLDVAVVQVAKEIAPPQ